LVVLWRSMGGVVSREFGHDGGNNRVSR
jgi:hypothetical protein